MGGAPGKKNRGESFEITVEFRRGIPFVKFECKFDGLSGGAYYRRITAKTTTRKVTGTQTQQKHIGPNPSKLQWALAQDVSFFEFGCNFEALSVIAPYRCVSATTTSRQVRASPKTPIGANPSELQRNLENAISSGKFRCDFGFIFVIAHYRRVAAQTTRRYVWGAPKKKLSVRSLRYYRGI